MIKKYFYLILVLLFFLLSSCAYRVAPDGGPIDTEPPKIIYTYPEQNTTNFNKNYIEVEFSEYIDKVSFRNAIKFSPKLKYDIEISWTGTKATIYFRDTLLPNTTYIITFTRDIVDYNNKNKLATPYQLKFSTGESIINNTISGKIFASKPERFSIWAYDLKKYYDPTQNYPDYLTQVDKDGNYSLTGLKNSIYAILAINDINNNNLYEYDEDYGIYYKPINFDTSETINNVDILVTSPNLTKITSIQVIDSNSVQLDFKYDISTYYKHFVILLIDSNLTIPINTFGLIDNNKLLIYSQSKIKSSKPKIIFKNEQQSIIDTLTFKNTKSKYSLITPQNLSVSNDIDIDDKAIIIKLPYFSSNNIIYNAITPENFEYTFSKNDDLNYTLKIKNNNVPSNLNFNINFKYLPNLAGNYKDTIVKYTIKLNTDNICKLDGKIISNENDEKLLIFKSISKGNLTARKISNNQIKINNLPQDKYQLFITEYSGINKYSYGSVKPLVFSKKFYYTQDTISLSKRWPLIDYQIIAK